MSRGSASLVKIGGRASGSALPGRAWERVTVNSEFTIPMKRRLDIIQDGFILYYYHEGITIAGNDGDDAKLYLEREVNRKIGILKAIEEEESES
ncbi:MAG: hypothetical protein WBA89_09405 [Microcoleus sp.]|uniref:hypothetical protein n=1 Tax=Microcoleus sp. TaxID=44472 RepID=UPI003C70BF99